MTSRIEMLAVPVRRRRQPPWLLRLMILLTMVVLVDSLFGERGLPARGRVKAEMTQAIGDLESLKDENAGLREQIRRLQSDPGAIESVAREELGLMRPGELVVLIAR